MVVALTTYKSWEPILQVASLKLTAANAPENRPENGPKKEGPSVHKALFSVSPTKKSFECRPRCGCPRKLVNGL